MPNQPFHLAIPVCDLNESRNFYANTLGFIEGRSSDKWVDFNMFGHQFVIHKVENYKPQNHFLILLMTMKCQCHILV